MSGTWRVWLAMQHEDDPLPPPMVGHGWMSKDVADRFAKDVEGYMSDRAHEYMREDIAYLQGLVGGDGSEQHSGPEARPDDLCQSAENHQKGM